MGILNHEQVDLNQYSQVLAALNKAIDGLRFIAADIQGGHPSFHGRTRADMAIMKVGNGMVSQILDTAESLEDYRSLFIGEGVDYVQFQKAVTSEAKREKSAEAEKPTILECDDGKPSRRAAGRRNYCE